MPLALPKPVGLSPLHRRLASMGATFRETSGWLVADHLGDARAEAERARSAVGLCDLSFAGKWELHGAKLAAVLPVLFDGAPPEPGHAAYCDGGYLARPTREQALWILDSANLASPPKFQGERNYCAHWIDRTSGFGRLLLCGPQASSVLRKLTPLDVRDSMFPNLRCAWTPMAAVRVLLVHKDRAALSAYEVFVSREYAEYLWDAMIEAGEALQLRCFGLEALGILEAS